MMTIITLEDLEETKRLLDLGYKWVARDNWPVATTSITNLFAFKTEPYKTDGLTTVFTCSTPMLREPFGEAEVFDYKNTPWRKDKGCYVDRGMPLDCIPLNPKLFSGVVFDNSPHELKFFSMTPGMKKDEANNLAEEVAKTAVKPNYVVGISTPSSHKEAQERNLENKYKSLLEDTLSYKELWGEKPQVRDSILDSVSGTLMGSDRIDQNVRHIW